MSKKPQAKTARGSNGKGCLVVFSSIFIIAGFVSMFKMIQAGDIDKIWLSSIFIIVGFLFMWAALTGKFKTGAGASIQDAKQFDDDEISRAPRELKSSSPMAKFVGIMFIAMFWNGLVGYFLWDSLPSQWGGGGNGSLFVQLFFIPFVLIGLVIIAFTIHQFLSLWNPRPSCKLEPGALRLGETGMLEWQFTGDTRRVKKLVITLEGVEKATYRQGTNTRTDKSTFAKIPIAETDDYKVIRLGQAEVTIPEFTAPTFNASNNKIQWSLKLEGEIPRWPDVSESYDIHILPLELSEG